MQTVDVNVPDRVATATQCDGGGDWVFVRWTVSRGNQVYRGQQLAVLKSNHTGAVDHIVAPRAGTLRRRTLRDGTNLSPANVNVPVAVIEFCPHSVVFRGICALCGSDVDVVHFAEETPSITRNSTNAISVGYDEKFLTVSHHVAKSVSASTAETLLRHRKLALVLDLDHTLVHATADLRANSILVHSPKTGNVNLKSVISFSLPDRPTLYRSVTARPKRSQVVPSNLLSPPMHLKLRPNLRTFLKRVSNIFQLHIYTMGSRPYADQVARIIDPNNDLFHGRVTSREDFAEGAWNRKKLKRLFPCDDSLAVIVDDREDVWIAGQDNSLSFMPNLVRAAPYFFWDGLEEVYDCLSPTNMRTHQTLQLPRLLRPTVKSVTPTKPSPTISKMQKPLQNGEVSVRGKVLSTGSSPIVEKLESEHENRPDSDKASNGMAKKDDEKSNGSSQAKNNSSCIPEYDGGVQANGKGNSEKSLQNVESETEAQEQELRKTVKEMWDKDVDLEAGKHLLRLAEVLEECHRRYFEKASAKLKSSLTSISVPETQSIAETTGSDVKEILSTMRSEVLRGCVITFSAVIPLHMNPENAPIWKLAIRLGAECLRSFTKGRTTHMVVPDNRRTNTAKFEEAVRSGCTYLVTTKWLDDCAFNFERREEFRYRVKDDGSAVQVRGDLDEAERSEYQRRVCNNFEKAQQKLPSCARRSGAKAKREECEGTARKKARLSGRPETFSNGYTNGQTEETNGAGTGEEEEVHEEELEAEMDAIFDDGDDD